LPFALFFVSWPRSDFALTRLLVQLGFETLTEGITHPFILKQRQQTQTHSLAVQARACFKWKTQPMGQSCPRADKRQLLRLLPSNANVAPMRQQLDVTKRRLKLEYRVAGNTNSQSGGSCKKN